MIRRISLLLPPLICFFALPLCAVWIHPQVETGIVDDWSYTRSAQLLAATGHIVYNGWATAMLGWQLYFGAALIKAFGFSFTTTRVGTLLVAMATAALTQRVLVRLGLTVWNSVAATLVFIMSPVFLPLSLSFMSDMYGLAALVGCCYCCARALQARQEFNAAAWVCVAAWGNALGGTARQIAWLGLLVMVPSTLWILRKNRLVLRLGGTCAIVGTIFVFGALHWYKQQSFVIVEPLLPKIAYSPRFLIVHMSPLFLRIVTCELLLLILPVSLSFTPAIFRSKRTTFLGSGVVATTALVAFLVYKTRGLSKVLRLCVPYMVSFLWQVGNGGTVGEGPVVLTPVVRVLLTSLLLFGGLGIACTVLSPKRAEKRASSIGQVSALSLRTTCVILLPCTFAYLLLLVPRHLTGGIVDRYLLFPEFSFLVFVVLLYQKKFDDHFHGVVWGLIAVMAAVVVATTHDGFSVLHAQVALQNEITASGVPRTAIDSGFEYNGWTEILKSGHINDPRMINPSNIYQPYKADGGSCHTAPPGPTPSVHAQYVLSVEPGACAGMAQFAPVIYNTYFAPHSRRMYVVLGPYAGVR